MEEDLRTLDGRGNGLTARVYLQSFSYCCGCPELFHGRERF
jgi:hypothetical protein